MTLLFSLHATPPRKGFGKPSVRAVPAALAGVYDDATREIWAPDRDAIREALPHQWRKAFDRSPGGFWYDRDARMTPEGLRGSGAGSTPYKTLYDTRGRRLATLYAIPYHFTPGLEA